MILPAGIAKLIEFTVVDLNATGLPQLMPNGEKCYVVLVYRCEADEYFPALH